MADVVQGCLDAGASQVDVAVEFAGAQSWIRVAADAGGTLVPPAGGGRHGLRALPDTAAGLDVLASCLSQASTLTVTTHNASGTTCTTTRWQRDAGVATGHVMPAPELPIAAPHEVSSTVLLLEQLDEVLARKRQEGRVIETAVARMRGRIGAALGLAFHRVLDPAQRRPVALTVNAEPVTPRDPFPRHADRMRVRRRQLPFVNGGRVEAVVATPHVLAPFEDDPAGGRQGFFVYLRDRLVQVGGWSRLSVADRGDAMARVAVDLPAAALPAFTWEALARRVLFPAALTPSLRAVALEAVTGGFAEHMRTSAYGNMLIHGAARPPHPAQP